MVLRANSRPGLPTAPPYAGLRLDRATGRRGDDAWVAAAAADPRARVRPLWRDQCLVAGDPAYARGLLRSNRGQRYCGHCGSPTETRSAGHLHACTDANCGALLFPRIGPGVITLVETIPLPHRCLMARHRTSKLGGYSLLAGFVEVGESFEDAVRREISEEVGIAVRQIAYVGSQPWPFPAGLMVAFRASAEEESVSVDGTEVLEARWLTREELREYALSTGRLGRPDSIDRMMLTAWLEEGE